ncbi:MAG: S-adenosylmethionine:tRNA ribosyltransferase-isomerase [Muribaculaceae bacterium]|nr:S-adenosylmethionine:tRNA ribosyltransferase-isomerase [Muribaculaceae bacterium]
MVQDIRIEDFSYELPENRIPKHPLEKRDECKLLLRTPQGKFFHRKFKELPDLLPPGSMLVCNDTKVINARILFHKDTGAAIEIFLLEPLSPSDYALNFQSKDHCFWKCLVGNLKKWKEGQIKANVLTPGNSSVVLSAKKINDLPEGGCEIEFSWSDSNLTFGQLLECAGKIPIPPYLNRESEECDISDYQTVFAEVKGSVAAPTAGLHFTTSVFDGLSAHAIPVEKLTLHVGAGTFRPVKSETIGEHDMHSEPFTVTLSLIKKLIDRNINGKPVVAVGTTSVRSLESLPYIGLGIKLGLKNPFHIPQWLAYDEAYRNFNTPELLQTIADWMINNGRLSFTATTAIMIAPGFNWRITDIMVTNFHQPKSTLLLLVSSFLDGSRQLNAGAAWRKMYEIALKEDYRFLSYGDACLLMRKNG